MEAVSRGDTALVLEREIELAAVDAFLADLTGGVSRFVAVKGPGGIGKTTLLAEARAAGRAAGIRVVSAQASELLSAGSRSAWPGSGSSRSCGLRIPT